MTKDILNKVLRILNANMKNIEITSEQKEDDLSTIGLDSITFIHIIVALEEEFYIEIPDEYLMLTKMNTISKMTEVVSAVVDRQKIAIDE